MTKTVKNVIGKSIETDAKLYGNYSKMSWTGVETDRYSGQLEEFEDKKMEAKKLCEEVQVKS